MPDTAMAGKPISASAWPAPPSPAEQHRLVNRTLGDIVPRIHALALDLTDA